MTGSLESLTYQLKINGALHTVDGAWLGESLLYVLRERLGLPGAKNACEQGECGSCSVLIDNVLVCSCLELAAAAVDTDIVTVEGVAGLDAAFVDGDGLTDVQRAFITEGAVQCGFCTPGLIVAVHDLLAANPEPTASQTREALAGNLRSCTGYGRIEAAVEHVIEVRRG